MTVESKESRISVLFGSQGKQELEMFRVLLNSKNPHLRKAAEKDLEVLRELGPNGKDVFDIYFNHGVDPLKINNTRYVQPGLTASFIIYLHGLEDTLGYEILPDDAGGYSLGSVIALHTARAIRRLLDLYNIVDMRAESMPFKHGYFKTLSIKAKEPVHIRRGVNWTLRGTGWRACIRQDTDMASVSGPVKLRKGKDGKDITIEEIIETSGIGKLIPIKDIEDFNRRFYIPFHHCREMKHSAKLFEQNLRRYCQKRKEETGEDVFRDLVGRAFVTNGGDILTKGKDIMEYIGYAHIVELCNFYETVKRIGSRSSNCLGIGLNEGTLERYSKRGYIQNFCEITDGSNMDEAARWYDTIIERRARELVRVPRTVERLVPAYSRS